MMADPLKADKLSFVAEWFDLDASIIRKFILSYFPGDCTVEMFDVKSHKLFLKRTICSGVSLKDVFVGNTLNIFSRQIKIVDYADGMTRKKMDVAMQRTFGMIKPDGIVNKGDIFICIYQCGFQISKMKMTTLTKDEASLLYSSHQGKPFFPYLLEHVSSGPVIVMELLAKDAVSRWRDLVGGSDPTEAKARAPGSIRAQFGSDITRNAVHASKNTEAADRESAVVFGSNGTGCSLKSVVQLNNSTCCVIKPHAVQEGLVGKIISLIEKNGFKVTGLELFYLDEINAEEFLEVYRGVVPEYMPMVKQMSSGPCVAMEVSSVGTGDCEVAVEFRKLVGPADPEIAKRIRPNTIRAIFGRSKVENAVHVTDLPEDAILEVEYFFKILPG